MKLSKNMIRVIALLLLAVIFAVSGFNTTVLIVGLILLIVIDAVSIAVKSRSAGAVQEPAQSSSPDGDDVYFDSPRNSGETVQHHSDSDVPRRSTVVRVKSPAKKAEAPKQEEKTAPVISSGNDVFVDINTDDLNVDSLADLDHPDADVKAAPSSLLGDMNAVSSDDLDTDSLGSYDAPQTIDESGSEYYSNDDYDPDMISSEIQISAMDE
jgi:hypothetical protein